MRSIERLLTPALTAALLLAGAAAAQAPDPKQGPPEALIGSTTITVDNIVERIMSFDKDKKGKVTKDDLPERMQFLIDLGDANKDGALDTEEIRNLAAQLAAAPGRFDGRVQVRDSIGPRPAPGGPPGFNVSIRPDTNAMEGVVEDLKLSGKKKDQAMAAVKAHQESVRKLIEQARADLMEKMKDILSEEELQDFKAALDRPRAGTFIVAPPPPDAARPGNVERKSDPRP